MSVPVFDADVKKNQWHLNTRFMFSNSSSNNNSSSSSSTDTRDPKHGKDSAKPTSHARGGSTTPGTAPGDYVPSALVTKGVLKSAAQQQQQQAQTPPAHKHGHHHHPPPAPPAPAQAQLETGSEPTGFGQKGIALARLWDMYVILAFVSVVAVPLQINRGPDGVAILFLVFLSIITTVVVVHTAVAWNTGRRVATGFGVLFVIAATPIANAHFAVEKELNVDNGNTSSQWSFFAAYTCLCCFYSFLGHNTRSNALMLAVSLTPVLAMLVCDEVLDPTHAISNWIFFIALCTVFGLAIYTSTRYRGLELRCAIIECPAASHTAAQPA